MTTIEIVTTLNILEAENKNAYTEYNRLLDIAYSPTESVEKMDLRAAWERVQKSNDALKAFEQQNWE